MVKIGLVLGIGLVLEIGLVVGIGLALEEEEEEENRISPCHLTSDKVLKA